MTVSSYRSGYRPAAIVAAVMLLLLLAASEFFSSGSTRHGLGEGLQDRTVVAAQAPCGHDHSGDQAPAHGHQSGDAWTSNTAPRIRQDGDTAGILMPLVHTVPALFPGTGPAPVASGPCDAGLTLLGVLRI
jgi:hypothetical protein